MPVMKSLRLLSFLLIILPFLTFSACDTDSIWQAGFSRGSIDAGKYMNRSFGLVADLPPDWEPFADPILDSLADIAKNISGKDGVKPLYLFALLNPHTASVYATDCIPLFRLEGISNIQAYAGLSRQLKNKELAAEGWEGREAEVEYLEIDGRQTAKITVDKSSGEITRLLIEYVYFYPMPISGEKVIVRHTGAIRDSADIPVVEQSARSFRKENILY
ncbi:MAG: hypothetical protein AB7H80_06510 [Candidatus Kapaibacterium sp.]